MNETFAPQEYLGTFTVPKELYPPSAPRTPDFFRRCGRWFNLLTPRMQTVVATTATAAILATAAGLGVGAGAVYGEIKNGDDRGSSPISDNTNNQEPITNPGDDGPPPTEAPWGPYPKKQ